MERYAVEMAYGIGFTIENIEASSREEAIKIARERIDDEVSILCDNYIDCGELEFEQVTFCEEF